jgi:hypothetical protein
MRTDHEHIATAATDEPAVPATSIPSLPAVRPSDQLTEDILAPALSCGADVRPGRTQREDGWTPERIRIFLTALAQCGVVGAAARAAGMNRQGAYALRASSKGRAFDLAWRAASQIAMQRLRDELVSRAINGYVEVTIRDGQVREERHRVDNRLGLAMLTRFENQARSDEAADAAVRFVVEEFDQFLDIACAGDAKAAADFIAGRQHLGFRGHEEAAVLERLENRRRYGVGLRGEALAPSPSPGRPKDTGAAARQPDAAPPPVSDPASAKPTAAKPTAASPPPSGLSDDGRPPSGWVAPGR